MFQVLREEFRKTPISISLALMGLIMICVSSGMIWQRISTPETTNNTIKNYQNNGQWQATIVYPNKTLPLEITHFHYTLERKIFASDEEVANKKMLDLSKQCLWWNETTVPGAGPEYVIITCFREKDPMYHNQQGKE